MTERIVRIELTADDLRNGNTLDPRDCPGYRGTSRVLPNCTGFVFDYFDLRPVDDPEGPQVTIHVPAYVADRLKKGAKTWDTTPITFKATIPEGYF